MKALRVILLTVSVLLLMIFGVVACVISVRESLCGPVAITASLLCKLYIIAIIVVSLLIRALFKAARSYHEVDK